MPDNSHRQAGDDACCTAPIVSASSVAVAKVTQGQASPGAD